MKISFGLICAAAAMVGGAGAAEPEPNAVFGVLLLGAATLFGAYQLVEKVEEVEEVEKVGEVAEGGRRSPAGMLSASGQNKPSASVPAQNEEVFSNDNQENTTQQA